VSVRLLTIKVSQWACDNFCSYRKIYHRLIGSKSTYEWPRVTTNDHEWPRVWLHQKMSAMSLWRHQEVIVRSYVWVIDQVWGQDGWILAKFFFCVFMDRDGVEVRKLAKKERGQYPAILTGQAWSIKDLLYGFSGNFSCGTRRVVPSGQDNSILPARVANHSAGFDSSCPLTELAI